MFPDEPGCDTTPELFSFRSDPGPLSGSDGLPSIPPLQSLRPSSLNSESLLTSLTSKPRSESACAKSSGADHLPGNPAMAQSNRTPGHSIPMPNFAGPSSSDFLPRTNDSYSRCDSESSPISLTSLSAWSVSLGCPQPARTSLTDAEKESPSMTTAKGHTKNSMDSFSGPRVVEMPLPQQQPRHNQSLFASQCVRDANMDCDACQDIDLPISRDSDKGFGFDLKVCYRNMSMDCGAWQDNNLPRNKQSDGRYGFGLKETCVHKIGKINAGCIFGDKLAPGDIILKLDSHSVESWTHQEIVMYFTKNSQLQLKIHRPSKSCAYNR